MWVWAGNREQGRGAIGFCLDWLLWAGIAREGVRPMGLVMYLILGGCQKAIVMAGREREPGTVDQQ